MVFFPLIVSLFACVIECYEKIKYLLYFCFNSDQECLIFHLDHTLGFIVQCFKVQELDKFWILTGMKDGLLESS